MININPNENTPIRFLFKLLLKSSINLYVFEFGVTSFNNKNNSFFTLNSSGKYGINVNKNNNAAGNAIIKLNDIADARWLIPIVEICKKK